jgi:hypothetical protein
MSSERRIRSSREDGAKSRGPKTPEGKARSCRNAIKHGLLSDIIVLGTEAPERFLDLSTELEQEFRPSTPFQRLQVETIAAAAWRIRRCWAFERASYRYENVLTLEAGFVAQEEVEAAGVVGHGAEGPVGLLLGVKAAGPEACAPTKR